MMISFAIAAAILFVVLFALFALFAVLGVQAL
jgi:hypothetical protein